MEQTVSNSILLSQELQLFERLELLFDERGKQGQYRTRIEDFGEKGLLVDRPTLVSGNALFEIGAYFTAIFNRPDSAYAFTSRVLTKDQGPLDAYWVSPPGKIERNQRRRFFRIDIGSRVTVIPAAGLIYGDQQEGDLPKFEGRCLNISGNGILVRSEHKEQKGAKLFLVFKLPGQRQEMAVIGIVRRAFEEEEGHGYGIEFFTNEELKSIIGAKAIEKVPARFLGFTENQRTKLLNYIFAEQVALKQKGLA